MPSSLSEVTDYLSTLSPQQRVALAPKVSESSVNDAYDFVSKLKPAQSTGAPSRAYDVSPDVKSKGSVNVEWKGNAGEGVVAHGRATAPDAIKNAKQWFTEVNGFEPRYNAELADFLAKQMEQHPSDVVTHIAKSMGMDDAALSQLKWQHFPDGSSGVGRAMNDYMDYLRAYTYDNAVFSKAGRDSFFSKMGDFRKREVFNENIVRRSVQDTVFNPCTYKRNGQQACDLKAQQVRQLVDELAHLLGFEVACLLFIAFVGVWVGCGVLY